MAFFFINDVFLFLMSMWLCELMYLKFMQEPVEQERAQEPLGLDGVTTWVRRSEPGSSGRAELIQPQFGIS